MSSIVPDKDEAKILFYQSKTTPWTANSAAIGTTAGAVTAMGTKVSNAQAKLALMIAAREGAKSATADFHLAVRELGLAGADIIKQIRAKAAADGPGVYVLAEIPAPAAPSPKPAPGKPRDFGVALREDGAPILTWACPNPAGTQGTVYQVSRQLAGEAGFTVVGATGVKKYTDTTLPAGAAAAAPVTYRVLAMRSTLTGLPGEFTVKFGVGGAGAGGTMSASVVSAPKLAA